MSPSYTRATSFGLALALLFPTLGVVAMCQSGMQASGQEKMACCRTMHNRCMQASRDGSGEGDCCRHNAVPATPVALVRSQIQASTFSFRDLLVANLATAARSMSRSLASYRLHGDESSPPPASHSPQLRAVLLI